MRLFLASTALVVLAIPTVGFARDDPSARAPDPNKMICRRIETIGTRLDAKRVCRTAAEWEAARTEDRQRVEQSQNQRHPGNE